MLHNTLVALIWELQCHAILLNVMVGILKLSQLPQYGREAN